ncbi:septal ring lytic transglycosylase RlpA family protein [Moorena sp. SIO4A5]|uniref:septal ring lytic transglycosylase RlpA family protein n=1 Tax=Moorena sp. SIO4A5 TaxID=2607838 RepID=UPI0013C7F30F|nr:septal ring lytic transglycosylase RlpA family protein [Moorena sp. SIO4A5]NEO25188.1 septal ring lytic transglycosylase RlpA family protein [Moorena sp. SIO4A5]NEO50609.1 septal ring lytic transglycosylase RlpA family protein [Moorena sp. SIO4A3]
MTEVKSLTIPDADRAAWPTALKLSSQPVQMFDVAEFPAQYRTLPSLTLPAPELITTEEMPKSEEKRASPNSNLQGNAMLIGYASPLKKSSASPQTLQPLTVPRIAKRNRRRVRWSVRGIASWYGSGFHGRRTASGERFNQYALTAAHRTLRFGTRVKVTNLRNGRSVIVRINDRGPYARGRIIDLSRGAARIIGLVRSGTGPVHIEILY